MTQPLVLDAPAADRLHIALLPLGSHGDVHPMIGLGVRLRQRGHGVTVLTNGYFESLCRDAGLEFRPVGTAEDYVRMAGNPDLWHPRRGFHAIVRTVMEPVPASYQHLVDLHAEHGDRLVVAASSLGLAARMAQEKFGLATATVHLAPALFQSVTATARYPGIPSLRRAPRWVRRGFLNLMNRVIDKALGPALNAFRADIDLPPVRGLMRNWWNSPQLVLAMFPEWFAPPQPDWPANVRTVGFPLYDERDVTPLPPALDHFLDEGPPPVAFTPGSAMFHGQKFFEASAEACRRAGLRGVLLSRHADHIPKSLPRGVIHSAYAPFSLLLPRCAAVVHHGGIGTTSQALAAGLPQLLHPFAHDQPDNAERLNALGVARTIPPRRYSPSHAAVTLRQLIESAPVREACRRIAIQTRGHDALGEASDLLESLYKPARTAAILI